MTIDSTKLGVTATTASTAYRAAGVQTGSAAESQSTQTVDSQTALAAAQTIQDHLSGETRPPQFSVDYLSGLDVMTVREASNGQVVFQIPGPAAIHLAQVLREGGSVDSFGLLDRTV